MHKHVRPGDPNPWIGVLTLAELGQLRSSDNQLRWNKDPIKVTLMHALISVRCMQFQMHRLVFRLLWW